MKTEPGATGSELIYKCPPPVPTVGPFSWVPAGIQETATVILSYPCSKFVTIF